MTNKIKDIILHSGHNQDIYIYTYVKRVNSLGHSHPEPFSVHTDVLLTVKYKKLLGKEKSKGRQLTSNSKSSR